MAEQSPDSLREAAPAYDDLEARRARAGVAAALFGPPEDGEGEAERVAVGRYEIDSRLGAGGMGVVYRAHDPDLDRPVAVKLLHADSSAEDKARARMLREARALAKLSHPNVITVYDVGTDEGQVFVAMELVAGRDLKRWLDEHRRAPWREVLELFIAAGRGLEAAHELALIHRDFKPENVLVGDDGRVRVLDFGLARVQRSVEAATAEDQPALAASPSVVRTGEGEGGERGTIAHLPTAALSGGLTETGALIGTPLYMAPELYAGRPADERSDQFAFCASLYEGLYRQLPYGSRNLPAHVKAVAEGRVVEPPAGSPVPRALWRVIATGLDSDPAARHRDMASLLAELERVGAEAVQPRPTQLPGGGSSWRWLGVGALVLAAVGGLVGLELGGVGGFGGRGEPVELALAASPGDPAPPAETGPGPADPPERPALAGPAETGEAEIGAAMTAETGAEAEAGAATETGAETETETEHKSSRLEPDLHGWCHLHEDRYTLLSRTSSRRANLTHQGTCYTCRVERRRSRTRNFSPRDCAGYSLCGEASAEACP